MMTITARSKESKEVINKTIARILNALQTPADLPWEKQLLECCGSHQQDHLKNNQPWEEHTTTNQLSSTVDRRIEFQATHDFSTTTRVYVLVLDDSLLKYNPVSRSVPESKKSI